METGSSPAPFANNELSIGKDSWDFVCKSDDGYNVVLGAHKEEAGMTTKVLDSIKRTDLNWV